MMKLIIIVFLIGIFFSLGSALYFLVKDKGRSDRTVKALTWRIALSLVLFSFLLIAFALGWMTPHSLA